ncbi:hypothetical protein F895_00303 [Acinetobacter sp. CIP 64.2]|nr:hypothetical protein F895_00303 [Acinetobacter sp. CIP 64.2]
MVSPCDLAWLVFRLVCYPKVIAFVLWEANAVDMTVLINKEKGEVVKIVDLRPWK